MVLNSSIHNLMDSPEENKFLSYYVSDPYNYEESTIIDLYIKFIREGWMYRYKMNWRYRGNISIRLLLSY